jgi:ABC-type transport system substrate-binding protein
MLILAGLGNPGPRYANNRHNIGFMAADAIASRWRFGPERSKFQSLASEGVIDTPDGPVRALLLKPQTYMNESGRAVGAAMQFYKAKPSEVVAFYEELEAFFTGAETDEVADILDRAIAEPDEAARGELYSEMQQLVASERNLIALDYRPWVWAMSDTVVGYDLPLTGIPWLADVGFSR